MNSEEKKVYMKTYLKAYYAANKEKYLAYSLSWTKANREKSRGIKDKWLAANPDRRRESTAKYRKDNPEKVAAAQAKYQSTNRAKYSAWFSRHRANKLNATPAWADMESIADVYKEAAYFGYEVDHIVPLNAKTVCGLHCWENLQLLPRSENRKKGNRTWPDMPEKEQKECR